MYSLVTNFPYKWEYLFKFCQFLWLQKRNHKAPSLNFLCYSIRNIGKRKIHSVLSQWIIFLEGVEMICSLLFVIFCSLGIGLGSQTIYCGKDWKGSFWPHLCPCHSAGFFCCVPFGLTSTFSYLRYGLSVILSSLTWWELRECQILIMGEHQNCWILWIIFFF